MAKALIEPDSAASTLSVSFAEYMRVPDELTVADDVVIEAKHGDDEIMFTRREIDDAEHLGEGVYRLKSGEELRFLSSATIH